MINLLPLQEKRLFQEENKLKIVLILGIIGLSVLLCFSLMLLAIRIYILSSVDIQRFVFQEKEKEFQASQLQGYQEKIIVFNDRLTNLNNFYSNQPDMSAILEKISKTLPTGAYLETISVNLPESGQMVFNISGFSASRDALLQFKENLEKEGSFTEINFPPGVWVEAQDIDFSTTFQLK